jgi:hypothetical protein
MCGRNRHRPASESEDDEAQNNSDVDSSSAFAVTSNLFRDRTARGPLLGPMAAFVPIPVFIGPARNGEPTQVAAKRAKKPATATAAADPKPTVPKPATTANAAAGFNLSPKVSPPETGTFTPAAAESKPAAPPPAAAAAKPKKPKLKKTAAAPAAKPDQKK